MGLDFDRAVDEVVWLAFLQVLSFGYRFDRPFNQVAWTACVQVVSLWLGLVSPLNTWSDLVASKYYRSGIAS